MSYFYFKCTDKVSEALADESLHTEITYPFAGNFHSFVWKMASWLLGGSYCKWQLYRGSKLLSEAEVVSWIPIFWFMPHGGMHIGPCRTVAEERGKGYYPYLLRQIVRNDAEKDYYMIVHKSNVSSIRGVMKAGFSRIGGGRRFMGMYVKMSSSD